MKKYFFLFFIVAITIYSFSCKKEKDDTANTITTYCNHITGVNLTALDAMPQGSIGTPDVNNQSDSFKMTVFPNPSTTIFEVVIQINNSQPLTLSVKLISAIYPNVPVAANIENANMDGQIVASQYLSLQTAPPDTIIPGGIQQKDDIGGQFKIIDIDVTNLPRGFYRLVIDIGNNQKYWENVWLN